jgi:hypothetical protein
MPDAKHTKPVSRLRGIVTSGGAPIIAELDGISVVIFYGLLEVSAAVRA